MADEIDRSACLSDNGLHRYRLSRRWATSGDLMAFIMLNPSTADGTADDPTIRRCMSFARREEWTGIEVLNLFAYRATNPAELVEAAGAGIDPEGSDNWLHWHEVLENHRIAYVVAAWGASSVVRRLRPSRALSRWDRSGWFCLGTTADGSPRHPLYVRGDQPLEKMETTDG